MSDTYKDHGHPAGWENEHDPKCQACDQSEIGCDALVRRIASMGEAEIQSAIDSNHPALDESTHKNLEADELAMRLIHGRHGKREIVNLLRWVMMGAPNAKSPSVGATE